MRSRTSSSGEPRSGASPDAVARRIALAFLAALAGAGCAQIAGVEELSGEELAPATPKTPAWSRAIGGSGVRRMRQIAWGAGDRLYVTGVFDGAVDLGEGPVEGSGSLDRFVMGLDAATGERAWGAVLGEQPSPRDFSGDGVGCLGPALRTRIAAARDGVLVAGTVDGTIAFGDTELTSDGADGFVAKLDTQGKHVWSALLGKGNLQWTADVTVDDTGLARVGGGYWLDLTPELPRSEPFGDVYTADIYERAGQLPTMAFHAIPHQGDEWISLLAGSRAGSFTAACERDVPSWVDAQVKDNVISRLDSSGQRLWSTIVGPVERISVEGIVADPEGGLVVAGNFEGGLTGDLSFAPLGGVDFFVLKLGDAGEVQWSKSFGGPGDERAFGLALGPGGEIVVAGGLNTTLDAGSQHLVSAGGLDAFVMVLDSAGEIRGVKQLGGAGDQMAYGVAVDASGGIFVAGEFEGRLTLDGAALQGGDGRDLFVAKLSSPWP